MAKKNIDYKKVLSQNTPPGVIANIFYDQIIKGVSVSYEMVAKLYLEHLLATKKRKKEIEEARIQLNDLSKGYIISNLAIYDSLKKGIANVLNLFEAYDLPIAKSGGQRSFYKYVGNEKNPLGVFQFKARIIDLRNDFELYIREEVPVLIKYKPFDKDRLNVVFHPHLIKEYNHRTFIMGVFQSEDWTEPSRRRIIALDRIEEVGDAPCGTDYIGPVDGEYDYLKHIVGVTVPKADCEISTIRLKALNRYTFGRITTKPLHFSQHVVTDFTVTGEDGGGFGEVEMEVYPTVELMSQLLSYGPELEVVYPTELRKDISDKILHMMKLYKHN